MLKREIVEMCKCIMCQILINLCRFTPLLANGKLPLPIVLRAGGAAVKLCVKFTSTYVNFTSICVKFTTLLANGKLRLPAILRTGGPAVELTSNGVKSTQICVIVHTNLCQIHIILCSNRINLCRIHTAAGQQEAPTADSLAS
jgi:hypothetical protein